MLQTLIAALAAATTMYGDAPAEAQVTTGAITLAQTRTTTQQEPRRVTPARQAVRATIAQAYNFHDPDATGWYFRYGLSGNAYKNVWDKYKADGFMPIDIETDIVGGATRFAGVWQKNKDSRGWVSYRNLTSDEFHSKWTEFKNKGYRPIDQDATVVGGSVRYSLIMVQNKEGLKWVSNRNLTSAGFSEKFNQYKGDYMPIDVDAVQVGGSMRYSVIWVENKSNTSWAELRDMSRAAYGEKFKEYSDKGYRVADLDCYANNGTLRYAAIWEKNKPGRAWAARREMSATGLKNWWKKYADQGMRVIDIEVCPAVSGNGVSYAAVWRENDERYDWSGRKTVEKEMKDYVDQSDAPGVGVAIMRNGALIFRGGAGDADTQNGSWAHGGTIYRLASISKSVTGVLAYDMEEAGIIDLDDDTTDHVSGLGSNHTHTVRDLVRMEGCVSHYITNDGLDDNGTQTTYSTALSALNNHIGGAIKTNNFIISGCSTGQYNYSTHSYVPAAAALEAAGGMSFSQLLKTRISDPFNLDTLRVETRTSPAPSGELAEVYGNGARVSASAFQNVTWKAPSGGMESSAIDLARFGDLVLRNRYFPQPTRDAMWTGANNGQGGGWGVTGVQRWKPGGQQGSDTYIVIDANTGTTVVVLVNKSSASIDSTTLANTILGIANAN